MIKYLTTDIWTLTCMLPFFGFSWELWVGILTGWDASPLHCTGGTHLYIHSWLWAILTEQCTYWHAFGRWEKTHTYMGRIYWLGIDQKWVLELATWTRVALQSHTHTLTWDLTSDSSSEDSRHDSDSRFGTCEQYFIICCINVKENVLQTEHLSFLPIIHNFPHACVHR